MSRPPGSPAGRKSSRRPTSKATRKPPAAPGLLQRLLAWLTGKKPPQPAPARPAPGAKRPARPKPLVAEASHEPSLLPSSPEPLQEPPGADFFDQFATPGAAISGGMFRVAFGQALDSQQSERLQAVVTQAVQPSQRLAQALQQKQGLYAGYFQELVRASEAGDYLGMCFVGSSLYVAASFATAELHQTSQALNTVASNLLTRFPERSESLEHLLVEHLETFQQVSSRLAGSLAPLVKDLQAALEQRDLPRVADLGIAMSRNALLLEALETDAPQGSPATTELSSLEVGERSVPLGTHVERLRQAVEARHLDAVADLARVVSLQASTRSDPLVVRALQLIGLAQQLQAALAEDAEEAHHAELNEQLVKMARAFHGTLKQRADQIADQVQQLQVALDAANAERMFSLGVALTRSSAILTDETIRLASTVAGSAATVSEQVRKGDLAGAQATLGTVLMG